MKYIYILCILCIIFIYIIINNKDKYDKIFKKKKKETEYNPYGNEINIDKKFYEIDVYPELKQIEPHKDQIKIEVKNILKNQSGEVIDCSEKKIYNGDNVWKLMPLYYYGTWAKKNCDKMPELTKFLNKLPKLKIALLSILAPKTVLKEHKDWGSHSNNVLRCHYGIIVPHNCYVGVKDDGDFIATTKSHANDEWIIFDDSKLHFSANNSSYYRVILILDLERPKYIKKGESEIGDSKELLEMIDYYKQNNIEINHNEHPMKNYDKNNNN
jgi:aspartyl/asparaginyl beta-hydroxylase (cupin superfamily)